MTYSFLKELGLDVKNIDPNNIKVYDDFAHHPTAIKTTLEGLRRRVGSEKIIALIEPRSNTMRMGIHKNQLSQAWEKADLVHLIEPDALTWSLQDVIDNSKVEVVPHKSVNTIVEAVKNVAEPGSHILVMSNGGFDGIHQKLLDVLGGANE